MTVEEAVKSAIYEHLGEGVSSLDQTLDDFGADSLDAVEVMMIVEELLDVEIDVKKLRDHMTVRDVIRLVEES